MRYCVIDGGGFDQLRFVYVFCFDQLICFLDVFFLNMKFFLLRQKLYVCFEVKLDFI